MKHSSILICCILSVMALVAPAEAAMPEGPWKIGHVRGEGSAVDLETRAMTEQITADTGGAITFEIYPASELGDYTVVQEQCAFGDIQMYIAPLGTMTDKRLGLPFIPYLVTSWADAKQVYAPDGVMMRKMAEFMEQQNLKLLGGWPVYFGGIVLTKEPPSPADPTVPKNLLIRVPPIKSFELTAKALGYAPYPITWMYAKSGLRTGMVKGMMGGGAEGYLGLNDLAVHYLAVRDHFEHWLIYMNLDVWNELRPEQQTIVQKAASEMEARRFEVAEAEEQANLKRLAEQGTNVITFSDTELASMAEHVRQTVWPALQKELGADFDAVVGGKP